VTAVSMVLFLGALIPIASGKVSTATTPKNLLTAKRLIVHKAGNTATAKCPAGCLMTGGGVTLTDSTDWWKR
jgi:uncharacterized membrane protein (DUF441 family)